MVARHLSLPYRFLCLTDDLRGLEGVDTQPLTDSLDGWWNKLLLFKPGVLTGRMLYLDLDVVIVDSLDPLAERTEPLCIIRDYCFPDQYNSSVMAFHANAHPQIWERFTQQVAKRLHGDQNWITEQVPGAYLWPPEWCVSYKWGAAQKLPKGARVVVMHGQPKPHELPPSHYLRRLWG
jgi:hypothetical protein